jgi:hypothetical protein
VFLFCLRVVCVECFGLCMRVVNVVYFGFWRCEFSVKLGGALVCLVVVCWLSVFCAALYGVRWVCF